MAMLYLVGLGLNRKQITEEGREALERCGAGSVFLEGYTSEFDGVSELALEYGADILPREEVESGVVIFNALERGDVCLLVVGDPLAATTHSGLILDAEKRGHSAIYVPGISVMTALPNRVGLSGYKFGRTTTLQFPEGEYFATSPYDILASNLETGLHTLVLLDIWAHKRRFMTPGEAFDILLESEKRVGKGIIHDGTAVCVVVDAFDPKEFIVYGEMGTLRKLEYPRGLASLMFPGKTHFIEEESLERFRTSLVAEE